MAAVVAMLSGCDTEVENIVIQRPNEYSEQYFDGLRAWKLTEHEVSYAYFASYRDPHLGRTFDVYAGIPEYLKNFTADEKEMTRFIIGTISGLDTPLTPSLYGMVSMRAYMNGLKQEDSQKMRDEILSATCEDIRALAPAAEALLADNYICVVGSEGKIAEHRELFGSVETLN